MTKYRDVTSFIVVGHNREWCRFDPFFLNAYLRNTQRYRNGELVDSLDVASVEVDESERGKGVVWKFFDSVERATRHHNKLIFVENVLVESFAKALEKRGYEKSITGGIPSFWFDPVGTPCLDLPDECFIWHSSKKQIALVKKGQCGFYNADAEGDEQDVAELNRKLGVNAAQAKAMELGSMLGWSVPAANPVSHKDLLDKKHEES